VGEALAQLPKAVAYYTVKVPQLLLNPVGTIRRGVEEQDFPAMRGMALLGWALPGLGISAAVTVICSFIVLIVTAIRGGGFAIGSLIGGIIFAAAVAVIGGAIIAFLYHRIFEFLIDKMKGHSDEKSRTNFLIATQVAGILSAVPKGLGVLFTSLGALIPVAALVALLPIVPSVVSLGATLITVLLVYRWFQYFEVHPVIPKVILALGALAVLFTAWGMLTSVRAAIASIGSGPSRTIDVRDVKDADTALETAQDALKKEKAAVVKEVAEKKVASKKEVKAAVEEAERESAKSSPPVAVTPPAPTDAEPETRPAPATRAPAPVAAEPEGQSPYEKYAVKRETVERRIAKDPTLLTRDEKLLTLYRKLHSIEKDARKSHGKGDDIVNQRLIEAETFERAEKVVDELYQRLAR